MVEFLSNQEGVELQVVTQRTQKDKIYGYRDTLKWCIEHEVSVREQSTFSKGFIEEVAEWGPDIIVNAYYPRIFPPELIKIPRRGCINVHPGRLPEDRGTLATAWRILLGHETFWMTVHFLDERIDTGEIIAQEEFPILEDETGADLYRRTMKCGAELLQKYFFPVVNGEVESRPQLGIGSFYNKIDPYHHLDWHQPREQIKRIIRVHAKPYYPAFCYAYNHLISINKVTFYDDDSIAMQGAGVIQRVLEDGSFVVSCTDGCLIVEDYEVLPSLDEEQFPLNIHVGCRLQ